MRLGDPKQKERQRAASVTTGAAEMRVDVVQDQLLTARSMIEHDEADVYDLWLQYFANGGNASQFEFETFLYGVNEPSDLDLDLLGLAIRELQFQKKPSEPNPRPWAGGNT